jgi:hypothetical protein
MNVAMNRNNISWREVTDVSNFAKDKYSYISDQKDRDLAILDFVGRYMDGGKFVVYNSRNQFLADFDVLDDAIYYKEEHEPKNELFSIECEILN